MLFRRRAQTRGERLAAADLARAHGRLRRAVAGYRRVLAEHGDDPHVHGRLAPLLARLDDAEGARASFRTAALGHARAGFLDRALAVYVQARAQFPLEADFHAEAARIHLLRGRRADAALALARGGRALGRTQRADAIEMLRGALALHPTHLDATLALAPLLCRDGRRDEALELLGGLEPDVAGRALRRVRGALFRAAPSPGAAWRWLSAALGRR
ncbi:MAG: tetratricopeptide repeat protein [Anaeromyxobacteraceae bacterium]